MDEKRSKVLYYKDFEFKGSNLAVKDVYIVENKFENQDKNAEKSSKYEIYDKDNKLIATVSEDGKIHFMPEYLEQLKNIDERYFEQLNLEELNFELPENLSDNDIVVTREELDDSDKKQDEEQKQEENETEDEKKEKSAEALGIEKEDIKSVSTINPNEKITDKYNLIDIMPEASEYENVSIVYSNSNNEGHGQFAILGVKQDGTREKIDSIDSIEGTTSNRSVISVNADGSRVEEKQVKGLFRINARNRDDGIAISVGDYGMMDIDYVSNVMDKENRRATPIRTREAENQRVTTAQVKENAGDTKEEMTKEGKIFKDRQEDGVNPQSLDGIDTDQTYGDITLEELKEQIKEKVLEKGDMSSGEMKEFIESEIASSGLDLTDEEIEDTRQEIQEDVLDESRFPTRGSRI